MHICSTLPCRDELLSTSVDQPVWRCHDPVDGHAAVLREFKTEPPRPCPSALEQFLLHRRLDGAGFVPAEDIISRDGRVVGFTTAYLGRSTLADVLGELSSAQLMQVLMDVALALFYLHSLDTIHGDLSLSNVLITLNEGNPRTYLNDLGFAVPIGSQKPTEIRGTTEYIAPEVLSGEPLTAATDVFSFGRLAAQVLSAGRDDDLTRVAARVFQACTLADPSARPQDMGSVHLDLKAIARERNLEAGPGARLLPPLRPTAVEFPIRRLRDALRQCQGKGTVAYRGPSGCGKTYVLRELSYRLQLEGVPTLRVVDVSRLGEAIESLDHALMICRREGAPATPTVLIETRTGAEPTTAEIIELNRWAKSAAASVMIELPVAAGGRVAGDVIVCPARRFTERGCLQATSHLLGNSALTPAHARSLFFATGGIPKLTRESMAAYIESGRRHRGDALDAIASCKRAAGYWRAAAESLPDLARRVLSAAAASNAPFRLDTMAAPDDATGSVRNAVEELCELGWLMPTHSDDGNDKYCFVAMSAVCYLKTIGGRSVSEPPRSAPATTSGDPVSVARDIAYIRRILLRRMPLPSFSEYRELCEAYSRLGSFRRRNRWARRAIRSFSAVAVLELSGATLADYCRLLDHGADPVEKRMALEALLTRAGAISHELQADILAELASALLLVNEFDAAYRVLLEALAHLGQCEHLPVALARVHNRIGVVMIMKRDWDRAGKHLTMARRHAQEARDEDILRRIEGNLARLNHAIGDPAAAVVSLRRVSRYSIRTRSLQEHLSSLLAETGCLVDLGRGIAAERHARLAHFLAEMLADSMRLGHAAGNLGWILTMKCRAGQARRFVESALRIRQRSGDRFATATTLLNLGRLHITARSYDVADGYCRQAMGLYESISSNEGIWDCHRLMALKAVNLNRLEDASEHLDAVPLDDPELPDKDRVDAMLLRADVSLWGGDIAAAEKRISAVAREAVVERVHPLRCRLEIARGHLEVLRGSPDAATDHLGLAAIMCRQSQRHDLLLHAILVRAKLALVLRNAAAGHRYVAYIDAQTQTMQEELK
jgi:tetratricopeptide (TPR) repeat protein